MRRPFEQPAAHHARLARRAAAGDRAAFVELYRALYPPVARFVARRVPARADAEDVVARTFHRLLEALPALDGARGTVLGYALTIARHAAADLRRAGAGLVAGEAAGGADGDGAPEPADGAPDALARLEADERLRALARVLDGLPAEARELIELRFGDGLKHAEIAALQGVSEAAVKQRVSRALRELRAALAGPGAGIEEVPS
jgi:RNA polymerase sigma-70 factor (ECF subfamily)